MIPVTELQPGQKVRLSASSRVVWLVRANDKRSVHLENPQTKRPRYFYKCNPDQMKKTVVLVSDE